MTAEDVDLTLFEEPYSLFSNMPIIEPIETFPAQQDLVVLNNQLSQMSIDLNTQNLRVKIVKVKRQKLRTAIRNIKNEILPADQIETQTFRTTGKSGNYREYIRERVK